MKKIAISLVLLLLLNLCGCSILPVGTNISSIETLKSWSFQYNEGTNDYSVFFALLTDTERYVSADVDADIRIVNENGEEVYKGTHSVSKNDFGYYSSQAAGEQYLANLKIPASDIMAGTSANGKVWNKKGVIYKGKIRKKDVLAYFSRRSESEVVIDVGKLIDVEEITYELDEGDNCDEQ